MDDPALPTGQRWADRGWASLERRYLRPKAEGRVIVRERILRVDAWSMSQVIAAAVTRAAVRGGWDTVDGLLVDCDPRTPPAAILSSSCPWGPGEGGASFRNVWSGASRYHGRHADRV